MRNSTSKRFVLRYAKEGEQKRNDQLLLAVHRNDVQTVRRLLEDGAEVNAESGYYKLGRPTKYWYLSEDMVKPLQRAAQFDYLDVMQLLIDYGADVNAQNSYGQTALHYAARYSKLNAFVFLVEHGANINIRDNAGKTCFVNVPGYLSSILAIPGCKVSQETIEAVKEGLGIEGENALFDELFDIQQDANGEVFYSLKNQLPVWNPALKEAAESNANIQLAYIIAKRGLEGEVSKAMYDVLLEGNIASYMDERSTKAVLCAAKGLDPNKPSTYRIPATVVASKVEKILEERSGTLEEKIIASRTAAAQNPEHGR
ncbi:MAG: ankyrin repeat protein [Rickettsiales bacterium]|jgi:hypothetical protein|nr:ankyrin repeat protein [Rickettsiales bacterium]